MRQGDQASPEFALEQISTVLNRLGFPRVRLRMLRDVRSVAA